MFPFGIEQSLCLCMRFHEQSKRLKGFYCNKKVEKCCRNCLQDCHFLGKFLKEVYWWGMIKITGVDFVLNFVIFRSCSRSAGQILLRLQHYQNGIGHIGCNWGYSGHR